MRAQLIGVVFVVGAITIVGTVVNDLALGLGIIRDGVFLTHRVLPCWFSAWGRLWPGSLWLSAHRSG